MLAAEQRAAIIRKVDKNEWIAIPWDEGWSPAPLVLKFALGDASVTLNKSPSLDAAVALGAFRVIPGTHVKLNIGQTKQAQVFNTVGQNANQVQSGFQSFDSGLIIDVDARRRVGGLDLSGTFELSSFSGGFDKSTRNFEGSVDMPIGEWVPLVVFGSLGIHLPLGWSVNGQAFVLWVRADYVEE